MTWLPDWYYEWLKVNGYELYATIISAILLPIMLYSLLRLSDKWNENNEETTESLKMETNIDKLNLLSKKVEAVSKELNQTFNLLAYDLSKRIEIIDKQKKNINYLKEQEKQLQDDVDVLKNTSVESAEYFYRAIKSYYSEVEKKSSMRATLFFFLGILSGIIIDIVKGLFF
ncbi:hypothetical protein [Desulfosporosinus sp. FKB]|uniref:hypothetical protein n=1 Tax=Desulfosporosinus sp. FKB TaxID=1969835 RepID=UPI000B49E723|nr:hypothetical protein [Desulfosporosinus sp. FKB]